jgi:DNA invertase Pin-like site-specific DNA recombinase
MFNQRGLGIVKKFVIYYRVSTKKQGRSGLGLEAQQQAVSDYLATVEGQVLESFTDIQSGKKEKRIALQAALLKCRLTGATLLIAKLDRLSRNASFLMTLQDSAMDFICCDMPEANRLTIGIMASLADYEGRMISERTKAALKAAKARGKVLGNPNLHLVRPSDTEAARAAHIEKAQARNNEVLKIINELKAEHGDITLSRTAELLNLAGIQTARGKEWTHVQVARLAA